MDVFEEDGPELPEIDVTIAHPARMYDYYLSGKTHFAADREAAEKVLAVLPEGRAMAIANRKKVFDMVTADRLLFAGAHLPFPGVGHAARSASGYTYVPITHAEHF